MYERGRVVAATFDGKLNEMQLYGLLFAGAVAAFCLNTLIGRQLGATAPVLSIVGNMTCGCSWLLVRALFQRPTAPRQWWPLAVVAAMVVVGATLRLVGDSSVPLLRILGNAEDLTSSTLLLLATIEPLRGIGSGIPFAEKRFRISFVASYAAVLIIAVLWVDGAPADSSPDPVRRSDQGGMCAGCSGGNGVCDLVSRWSSGARTHAPKATGQG